MVKGQKWIIANKFVGDVKDEDIKLVDFELPPLKENEVLLQSVYLTVDPYMRAHTAEHVVGNPMPGQSVAEVLESKNKQFPVGSLVMARSGWQSHFISNGKNIMIHPIQFNIGKSTPISYTLGVLGMPGATAYFGLRKCEPKKGETLFVSSAAGAVGHVVGQLAKAQGLTVIGSVSSAEKVNWLKELGFDHVINYKTHNVFDELKRLAPNGIDIYFDNVGADYYHNLISDHLNKYGRILCCGSIENYNQVDPNAKKYAPTNIKILHKELSIYGMIVSTFFSEWGTAFTEMNKLVESNQLKTRETVFTGFDQMRNAFFAIFNSSGIGKQVIKCVNPKTNYP